MIAGRAAPVIFAAALVVSCSFPKGADDVDDPEETTDPSAPPPSASPQTLFQGLEERLLHDPDFGMQYAITAEGAVTASLTGTLHLVDENEVELLATGTFADIPVKLSLRSDGRRMDGGSQEHTFTMDAAPALREALVIGLTRMGLLHNLARLSAGSSPDHAEGGVREWVQTGDVSGGGEPETADAPFVELRFPIFVSGQRSAEVTLWVDRATGLPARREQVVRFPTGEMRVFEEYELLAPVAPVPTQ